jgi:cell division protein ZapB
LDFSRKLTGMSVSLDHLERKVDQILAVCASLRDENQTLRVHVAGLEAEKAALTSKIDVTRERLEALITRLPEE